MTSPSRNALVIFVEELQSLRGLCGSPSLNDLVECSADLTTALARSTISDKLNAKSLPDWDFVVSFVSACRSFAEKAGTPAPAEAVDLARWDARHLRLLRDLDVARRDERLAAAARSALGQRDSGGDAKAVRPIPRQLPAAVRHFVGRGEQLRSLAALAQEAAHSGVTVVISAIHGTAGVGKTALAVHAAHLLAGLFPDGQLYVDLRGFDPSGQIVSAADAVRDFLDSLAVPPERLPGSDAAQLNLYRSLLADRRVLILLDNARDAEHVRPLVPGTPGSLVLVTSRDRLTSLVAREGAFAFPLGLLSDVESRQLLVSRIGGEHVREDAGAVNEIVARCARLPLALSVVAARASSDPARSLAMLARGLRAVPGGLDMLETTDPATGIRQALFWSYRQLSDDAASLFRSLALHPGPDLSPTAAAGLAGLSERRARAALGELADAHLVEEHDPARFGFHDLLRAYARELSTEVDSEEERRAALGRMLDHYLRNGHRAALVLEPHRPPITLAAIEDSLVPDDVVDQAAAMTWFAAERRVLLGLIEFAAHEGFETHAWQLAWTLTDFFNRTGHWQDWARAQEVAIEVTQRLGDKPAMALMNRNLSFAYVRLDRYDKGLRACRRALALHRQLGDADGQAQAHLNLGGIAVALASRASGDIERRSRRRTALRHASRAADLFRGAGSDIGTAKALNNVGWVHTQLGDHRQAIVVCEQALAILEKMGVRHAQAETWDSLGYAHHHLHEDAEAVACYRRALDLFGELGDRAGEADTLTHLGETHHRAGDIGATRDAWGRALAILLDLDDPSAESLRARLAVLDQH